MNGDLISRSALLEEIKRIGGQPYSEWETLGVLALAERIPAVDAETVFEAAGLVKEAFDMAKSNLAPVIRCKDCYYWMKAKVNKKGFLICPASGMEITANDYCSYAEKRKCKYDK